MIRQGIHVGYKCVIGEDVASVERVLGIERLWISPKHPYGFIWIPQEQWEYWLENCGYEPEEGNRTAELVLESE